MSVGHIWMMAQDDVDDVTLSPSLILSNEGRKEIHYERALLVLIPRFASRLSSFSHSALCLPME